MAAMTVESSGNTTTLDEKVKSPIDNVHYEVPMVQVSHGMKHGYQIAVQMKIPLKDPEAAVRNYVTNLLEAVDDNDVQLFSWSGKKLTAELLPASHAELMKLVEPVPLLKPKRSDIQIVLNVGSVFPRFALKRKLMKCLTTNHLWMKPYNSLLSNEEMTTAGFFSKLCCDDVLRVSLAHEINVLLKAERLKQGKKFDSKFQIPAHHVLRVSVTNRVVYSRSNEAQAEAIVLECPKRMLNGVISLLPRVTQQLSCQNTTINEIVFISAKLPYSKEVSNAAAIYDAAIVEQSRYCECHTNFRIGGISSDVMNNSFRETIFEACDSIHGIYPTMLTSSEGVWIVSTTISCVDQAHQWCDDN